VMSLIGLAAEWSGFFFVVVVEGVYLRGAMDMCVA